MLSERLAAPFCGYCLPPGRHIGSFSDRQASLASRGPLGLCHAGLPRLPGVPSLSLTLRRLPRAPPFCGSAAYAARGSSARAPKSALMTLPALVLAVELAFGGFNVANLGYSTACCQSFDSLRRNRSGPICQRTRGQYTAFSGRSQLPFLEPARSNALRTAMATARAISGGTALPICWYWDSPFSHDIFVLAPMKTCL